ncbi:MAG TPA: hypothetical protein VFR03_09220 [Thermoanaerobaculia bacterium]|nr:hypothetical protein [Thermoanaerobaculia bacterium]
MKIASRTIASAAVVALLLPMMAARPAEAQRNVHKRDVAGITILVRNITDKTDAARIEPGGTITIAEGAHVRVNVEAQLYGSRTPVYPVTEFTDLNRGGVRITRGNAANAAVDLEVLPMRNPNRIQRIGYTITDNRVPADLRTGTFNIQVAPPTRGSAGYDQPRPGYDRPGYGRPGGAWSYERARDLTRALYQGILMRDPDPGANGTIDSIRNGGYSALVDAAVSIANSNESRITIPGRGVGPVERLNSLYQNLLGLSNTTADQAQWNHDFRAMRDGQIAQVVEGIVRSDRFRSRYSI